MARSPKCKYCEEEIIDKDNAIKQSSKWYHNQCYETWQLESQHRKELIEYICEIYKIKIPNGMMLKQIKDFHEEFGYKYKGMELALRYFYETLNKPVQDDSGIGIIPFMYDKAKKHYIMKMNVEKSIQEHANETVEERVVTISSPKVSYKKKIQQIDITSL